MAALPNGPRLLESAVSYALASTRMVTPHLLSRPTPCPGWDLAMLLDHVSDSADVLHEATSAGSVDTLGPPPGGDPVRQMRGKLTALLAPTAAIGPADRPLETSEPGLTANLVALTGATEITVHGWDIAATCGANRPLPPGLATVLLATAPLLVPPDTRPGLFADPVRLRGPADPGDELLAFLGRRPLRGDFEPSTWSA